MQKRICLSLLTSLIIVGQIDSLQAHPGDHGNGNTDNIPGMRRPAPDANTGSMINITIDGQYRNIQANGIPNHITGSFPNKDNPNQIRPQRYNLQVPIKPQLSANITPLHGMPFGIAINGVVFDPGTAELWNNDPRWHYEALTGHVHLGIDGNQAHVQPSGAYHYHGLPTGLAQDSPRRHSRLIGYAADGFPVYSQFAYSKPDNPNSPVKKMRSSYRLKQGNRTEGPTGKYDGAFAQDFEYVAGSGDLDECNGRTGRLPNYPNGSYAYFVTEEFPFIPRCLKGMPDSSFARLKGPPMGVGGNSGQMPPPGQRPPPSFMRPPFGFPPPPR